jgi:vacuolar-type H+-ATPase subunit I/STV1
MPESDKSSLLETLVRAIAQRTLGFVTKYVQRVVMRALRLAGLYAAGFLIAMIGLIFIAVGVVKWLAMIVPSWLAWLMVGIVMLLLGVVFVLAAFLASKS